MINNAADSTEKADDFGFKQQQANGLNNSFDIVADKDTASKPIKKKDAIDEDDESDQHVSSQIAIDSPQPVDLTAFEDRAKRELISFLSNKNVDLKYVDDFKIHLRRVKNKKGRESSGLGYSVTYSSNDGSILTSKTDVLNAIMHNVKKSKNGQSNIEDDHSRQEYYAESKNWYSTAMKELPADFGDIRLLDIGRIDKRSSFHNSVQIYPVGYKCEQVINTNSAAKGIRQTSVLCEIVDVDGDPEFLLTVKSTGQTYIATSEEEAWKRFDPTNVDKNWCPSFFNLEIELLIEGLEGSIDCVGYKFHAERGYGITYFTNEQALASKKSYLLKSSREKRNKSRQRGSTGPDDSNVDDEDHKRPSENKDRLLREKEEATKRKALIRESIKEQKDIQRKHELAIKEKLKQEEKEMKEKMRAEDKLRQQVRKDLRQELKKSQADAAQLLLQRFDAEENSLEQAKKGSSDTRVEIITQSSSLDSIIQSVPDALENFNTLEYPNTASLMLEACNSLFVFRNHLKLHFDPLLDEFINSNSDTSVLGERGGPKKSMYEAEIKESKDDTKNISCADKIDDETNEEAEWDESKDIGKKNSSVENDLFKEKRSKEESFLERIQLCLAYALREPLLDVLDINDPTSNDTTNSKRDKPSVPITLPLNQLTWTELARMNLLSYLFSELGKTREDIQGALRGGKHTNLKATSKSIIKYIKCRMAVRAFGESNRMDVSKSNEESEEMKFSSAISEDILLSIERADSSQPLKFADVSISNSFNNEEEIIQSLASLPKSEYSESYLRCAKVFLKIIGTAQAKNLIWEVDREAYFDYYQTIKGPMAFVNVATSLLNKSYGEDNTTVYDTFYRDMKQVLINCSTFNTESTYLFIQAQKLIHVLFRHMQRWVWTSSRPDVAICDEQHCIWSFEAITSNLKSIRCDRCLGAFSLDYMFTDHSKNMANEDIRLFSSLILPSQDQIDQNHEEWYCPFCLKEDSIDLSVSNGQFVINEWGTSSTIPWLFNSSYSTIFSSLLSEFSYLIPVWKAFEILSKPFLLPTLSNMSNAQSWTSTQRIIVLTGLCRALNSDPKAIDYLQKLALDCEKLLKMSSKSNFREADFMKVVKEVIGEDGVALCRSFLDGIDSRDKDLYKKVTEGRCVVCKGSTYEEDNPPDTEVILCDGCDSEAHLHCLNFDRVPSSEWHCPSCAERIAKREMSKSDHSIGNIDEYRSKDVEEELMNKSVSEKSRKIEEAEKNPESLTQLKDEAYCLYCGMTELDLCSPFVLGQCREEHDFTVKGCQPSQASGVFSEKNNTSITFLIDGVIQEPPKVSVPFFPMIGSEESAQLIIENRLLGREPEIVHEVCALQMFQARLDRSKHTLRRRRKLIGDHIVGMSGLCTISLGKDLSGRSYWKFPTSEDLFILSSSPEIAEKREFSKLMGKKLVKEPNSMDLKWKRVSDTNTIRTIATLLDQEGEASVELKQNILTYILMKRELKIFKSDDKANKTADTTADSMINEADDNNSESGKTGKELAVDLKRESSRLTAAGEGTPVALKLLADKGQEVPKTFDIAEEAIFEDVNAIEDDEDDTSRDHREYFTYSRNKYFAIAIVNNTDKKLKYQKGEVTVVYQVHLEGIATPLAYTPLDEQWNDNVFYFSTVYFKKSGTYTISFIVEGADFSSKIEPLMFSVVVKAQNTLRGPKHALSLLNAKKHVLTPNRQISWKKRELNAYVIGTSANEPANEFEATKTCLLTLYAALPSGSLTWNSFEASGDNSRILDIVANSAGWNDEFDQVWRGTVEAAENPKVLMECLLVLEFYLNKSWLCAPYNKLLSCLPLPHFAVKCPTVGAIALRIFCIDKALLYEKAILQSRVLRQSSEKEEARPLANTTNRTVSRPSRLSDPEPVVDSFGRGRRQASVVASSKIQSQSNTASSQEETFGKRKRSKDVDEDEDVDDEDVESEDTREVDQIQRENSWTCAHCKSSNEARARSCDMCGERKLPVSLRKKLKSSDSLETDDNDSSGTIQRGWQCNECHGMNEPRARSCSDCGERKSIAQPKQIVEERTSNRLLRPTSRSRSYADEEEAEFSDEDDYRQKKVKKFKKPESRKSSGYEVEFPVFNFEKIIDEANDETTKKFYRILSVLYKDPTAVDFWVPVDIELFPEYAQVVQAPMDLGTITKYVEMDYYGGDHTLFSKDVRLVWSNCKLFNMEGSVLYQNANKLSKTFEKLFSDMFSD